VAAEILDDDGTEAAQAQVQGDGNDFDALLRYFFQQGFGEMESGGWRRDGAAILGIHRLVAVFVHGFGFPPDIGWQRRFADAIDDFEKITAVIEPHHAAAGNGIVDDIAGEFVADGEAVADADFARGFDEHLPQSLLEFPQ